MKQYCLKIQSKNEKSLKNFLYFFFKHLKTKFNIIQRSNAIQSNRKVITFLKSPHVNKTAQEHFEMHILGKKMLIKGVFLEKLLIFLKRILIQLFQDTSICLEFITSKKVNEENNLLLLNPDNIRLSKKKLLKKNFKRSRQKIILKNSDNQKDYLFYLTKLLNKMSLFGETLLIFCLKQ